MMGWVVQKWQFQRYANIDSSPYLDNSPIDNGSQIAMTPQEVPPQPAIYLTHAELCVTVYGPSVTIL